MKPRLVDPTTSDTVSYSQEEVEFMKAMERYMRVNKRKFPTFREVLAVAKSIGYRLVTEAEPLPKFLRGAETLKGQTRGPAK